MTICQFKDESFVKCKRKAVSSFKGKPYCNKHLQQLRRISYERIGYEDQERKYGVIKGDEGGLI